MPRTCTICTHPQRTAMEHALGDGLPLRTIADRWSVSKTALIRHKADHLPERPMPPSPASSQPVFPVARTTRRLSPLRQTGCPVAPSTVPTITPLLESADVLFPEILHPKKRAFLAAYVTCGRRGRAAEAAGVKHQHYLYWFATDPAFTEAFAREVVPLPDTQTPGRPSRDAVFRMLDRLNQRDSYGDTADDG